MNLRIASCIVGIRRRNGTASENSSQPGDVEAVLLPGQDGFYLGHWVAQYGSPSFH